MSEADRVWRERGLREAVLAGDERAWRTWYDESFAALDAYVAWRCGGLRDLADEVLQETWLVAVRRVRDFQPDRGAFQAWLRGIAGGVIRNRLRRRQRDRTVVSLNGDVASGQPHTDKRERKERVAEVLAKLPEHYEAVLRAKYLDGKTMAEIATEWNDSLKSVESLLTRARDAFRQTYSEE
ncbi:MAG TPA: sigma-70 family RNA polymerase sigma factor [Gemmataceae bacterium]|nr:sigma-70 family RNA polymerase sigma factor [Gemmataceae bacterium]